ncbi:MAG: phosphonopyruvate decarboxylase [Deltaproteobacteria bacterium]|nr:MAG: phosphonopyruvate decarboxylase [Deltaproteobacteria bacterium]
MVECASFVRTLADQGVQSFFGVPDSLLKDLCAFLLESIPAERHIVAVNEGAAVALATGHHLATGEVAGVYMQNSGLGNALNPLGSLAHPEVFGVPMVLIVGWRGQPGRPDEPQHMVQGRATIPQLSSLAIPHRVMSSDHAEALAQTQHAVAQARERRGPVALIVPKGTFQDVEVKTVVDTSMPSREQAVAAIVAGSPSEAALVATTGKAARELYEHRQRAGQSGAGDVLVVGAMGHASSIALGLALSAPGRPVVCLDGDGALLMHMGAVAAVGASAPRNFIHIVLNNRAHDSVGGQPTIAGHVDLPGLALAVGYQTASQVSAVAELQEELQALLHRPGPHFLEVLIRRGARSDLSRPSSTPSDRTLAFRAWIERS